MQYISNTAHFHAPHRAPIYGSGSQSLTMEQLPTIRSDVLRYLERNSPAEHAVWVQRIAEGEAIEEK